MNIFNSKSKKKQFLVAGLGLFGSSVAVTLEKMGFDILAIDSDDEIVQDMSTQLSYVICADASVEKNLDSLALQDIDVAVVAIGNMERNLMCTMLLKEKGIPFVVSKALNDLHGAMLMKLGADKVIYAEKDMGKRVAHNLVSSSVMDYIEMSDKISIMSIAVPEELYGKNLIEANLRKLYNVNVVAIKRGEETMVNPHAHEVFQPGDEMIVVGTHSGVKEMGVDF